MKAETQRLVFDNSSSMTTFGSELYHSIFSFNISEEIDRTELSNHLNNACNDKRFNELLMMIFRKSNNATYIRETIASELIDGEKARISLSAARELLITVYSCTHNTNIKRFIQFMICTIPSVYKMFMNKYEKLGISKDAFELYLTSETKKHFASTPSQFDRQMCSEIPDSSLLGLFTTYSDDQDSICDVKYLNIKYDMSICSSFEDLFSQIRQNYEILNHPKVTGFDVNGSFGNAMKIISYVSDSWDYLSASSSISDKKRDSQKYDPLYMKNSVNDSDMVKIYSGEYGLVPKNATKGNYISYDLVVNNDEFNQLSNEGKLRVSRFLRKGLKRFNDILEKSTDIVVANVNSSLQRAAFENALKENGTTPRNMSGGGSGIGDDTIKFAQSLQATLKERNLKSYSDGIKFIIHDYIPRLTRFNQKVTNKYGHSTAHDALGRFNSNNVLRVIGIASDIKPERKVVTQYIQSAPRTEYKYLDREVKVPYEKVQYVDKVKYVDKVQYVDRPSRNMSGGDGETSKSKTFSEKMIEDFTSIQKSFNDSYEKLYRTLTADINAVTFSDPKNIDRHKLSAFINGLNSIGIKDARTTSLLTGLLGYKNYGGSYLSAINETIANAKSLTNADTSRVVNTLNNVADLVKSTMNQVQKLRADYVKTYKNLSETSVIITEYLKRPCRLTHKDFSEYTDAVRRLNATIAAYRNESSFGNAKQRLNMYLENRGEQEKLIIEHFEEKKSAWRNLVDTTRRKINNKEMIKKSWEAILNQQMDLLLYFHRTFDPMLMKERLNNKDHVLSPEQISNIEKAFLSFKSMKMTNEFIRQMKKLNKTLEIKNFGMIFKLIKQLKALLLKSQYISFISQLYHELGIVTESFDWSKFADNLTSLIVLTSIKAEPLFKFGPSGTEEEITYYEIVHRFASEYERLYHEAANSNEFADAISKSSSTKPDIEMMKKVPLNAWYIKLMTSFGADCDDLQMIESKRFYELKDVECVLNATLNASNTYLSKSGFVLDSEPKTSILSTINGGNVWQKSIGALGSTLDNTLGVAVPLLMMFDNKFGDEYSKDPKSYFKQGDKLATSRDYSGANIIKTKIAEPANRNIGKSFFGIDNLNDSIAPKDNGYNSNVIFKTFTRSNEIGFRIVGVTDASDITDITYYIVESLFTNILNSIDKYWTIKYEGTMNVPLGISGILRGGTVFDSLPSRMSVTGSEINPMATPFYISAFYLSRYFITEYCKTEDEYNAMKGDELKLVMYITKVSSLYPLYEIFHKSRQNATIESLTETQLQMCISLFNEIWKQTTGDPASQLTQAIDNLFNQFMASMLFTNKIQMDMVRNSGTLSKKFLNIVDQKLSKLTSDITSVISSTMFDSGISEEEQAKYFERGLGMAYNKIKNTPEQNRLNELKALITNPNNFQDNLHDYYKFMELVITPLLISVRSYSNIFSLYDLVKYGITNSGAKLKDYKMNDNILINGKNESIKDIHAKVMNGKLEYKYYFIDNPTVTHYNAVLLENAFYDLSRNGAFSLPKFWIPMDESTYPRLTELKLKSSGKTEMFVSHNILTLRQLYPKIKAQTLADFYSHTVSNFVSDFEHFIRAFISYPGLNDKAIKLISDHTKTMFKDILSRDISNKNQLMGDNMLENLKSYDVDKAEVHIPPPCYPKAGVIPAFRDQAMPAEEIEFITSPNPLDTQIDGYSVFFKSQNLAKSGITSSEYSWLDWVVYLIAKCDTTNFCIPYKFFQMLTSHSGLSDFTKLPSVQAKSREIFYNRTTHGAYNNIATQNILLRSNSGINKEKADYSTLNHVWVGGIVSVIPYILNGLEAAKSSMKTSVEYNGRNVHQILNYLIDTVTQFYNEISPFTPKISFMHDLAYSNTTANPPHILAEILELIEHNDASSMKGPDFIRMQWANKWTFENIIYHEHKDYDTMGFIKKYSTDKLGGAFGNEFKISLQVIARNTWHALIAGITKDPTSAIGNNDLISLIRSCIAILHSCDTNTIQTIINNILGLLASDKSVYGMDISEQTLRDLVSSKIYGGSLVNGSIATGVKTDEVGILSRLLKGLIKSEDEKIFVNPDTFKRITGVSSSEKPNIIEDAKDFKRENGFITVGPKIIPKIIDKESASETVTKKEPPMTKTFEDAEIVADRYSEVYAILKDIKDEEGNDYTTNIKKDEDLALIRSSEDKDSLIDNFCNKTSMIAKIRKTRSNNTYCPLNNYTQDDISKIDNFLTKVITNDADVTFNKAKFADDKKIAVLSCLINKTNYEKIIDNNLELIKSMFVKNYLKGNAKAYAIEKTTASSHHESGRSKSSSGTDAPVDKTVTLSLNMVDRKLKISGLNEAVTAVSSVIKDGKELEWRDDDILSEGSKIVEIKGVSGDFEKDSFASEYAEYIYSNKLKKDGNNYTIGNNGEDKFIIFNEGIDADKLALLYINFKFPCIKFDSFKDEPFCRTEKSETTMFYNMTSGNYMPCMVKKGKFALLFYMNINSNFTHEEKFFLPEKLTSDPVYMTTTMENNEEDARKKLCVGYKSEEVIIEEVKYTVITVVEAKEADRGPIIQIEIEQISDDGNVLNFKGGAINTFDDLVVLIKKSCHTIAANPKYRATYSADVADSKIKCTDDGLLEKILALGLGLLDANYLQKISGNKHYISDVKDFIFNSKNIKPFVTCLISAENGVRNLAGGHTIIISNTNIIKADSSGSLGIYDAKEITDVVLPDLFDNEFFDKIAPYTPTHRIKIPALWYDSDEFVWSLPLIISLFDPQRPIYTASVCGAKTPDMGNRNEFSYLVCDKSIDTTALNGLNYKDYLNNKGATYWNASKYFIMGDNEYEYTFTNNLIKSVFELVEGITKKLTPYYFGEFGDDAKNFKNVGFGFGESSNVSMFDPNNDVMKGGANVPIMDVKRFVNISSPITGTKDYELLKQAYDLDGTIETSGISLYGALFKISITPNVKSLGSDDFMKLMFKMIINYFNKHNISLSAMYSQICYPATLYNSSVLRSSVTKLKDLSDKLPSVKSQTENTTRGDMLNVIKMYLNNYVYGDKLVHDLAKDYRYQLLPNINEGTNTIKLGQRRKVNPLRLYTEFVKNCASSMKTIYSIENAIPNNITYWLFNQYTSPSYDNSFLSEYVNLITPATIKKEEYADDCKHLSELFSNKISSAIRHIDCLTTYTNVLFMLLKQTTSYDLETGTDINFFDYPNLEPLSVE